MAIRTHILGAAIVGLLVLWSRSALRAQVSGESGESVHGPQRVTPVATNPAVTPASPGDTSGVVNPGLTPDAPAVVDSGAVEAEKNATQPKAEPKETDSEVTEAGEKSGAKTGKGLKGVINLLTGKSASSKPGEETTEEAQKATPTDENQKRVNELARLATTNIEKDRVAEAVRNITDLITLKPYEANYHFALGLCYRREAKFKESLKKYQDVLDLGGPKALVAVLRAEAYAAEGRSDKVFEYLREAAIGGRNVIMDVRMLPLLSVYQQDTEFIKLALQLEKFTVTKSKAFDPFTNPFPRPDTSGSSAGEGGESVTALSPEDQEKLLLEARKTYERVKFYIKLEDETKAMKAYGKLRDLVKQKDLLTIPKIVNDFRILVAQLEGLEIEIEGIRLKYYYGQAQAKLKQMKDFFGEGEYQSIEKLHSEVVKLTEEMRQVNTNYKPVGDQILAASTRWLTRAQVRKDFQLRKPVIQGIVISANGKMALLNEKLVKQGEAFGDFRVVKVESNKVTFRYKGEEIPLVFRRY